jgi:hypothetical protein
LITAAYTGDLLDKVSTSAAATVNVGADRTKTVVTPSTVAPVVGQSFTLQATVTVRPLGRATPTGSVTFYDGTTMLQTVPLSGGAASLTLSYPATGSHTFSAVYSGDTNDRASTSAVSNVTVGPDTTKTSVSFSPNPVVVGQPVNLIATVSVRAPGRGTPTGSVKFMLGTVTLGTAPLSGNKAILPWAFATAGSQTIKAVYLGDADDKTSSGAASRLVTSTGAASLLVSQNATKATLTSNAKPAVLGQPVTFTATVAAVSPGAGTPTGSVVLKDGTTVPLTGGVGIYTTSAPTQGLHSITGAYQGDANYRLSTSAGLAQRILSATSVGLSSSDLSAAAGTPVTFMATVSDVAPGTGTPTGLVSFYDGTTLIGTATLVAGVARLRLLTLGVGSHAVSAVYAGDDAHQGGRSPSITRVIS